MDTSEKFLHQLLNMGSAMLSVGGEVNRVEDTLNRMGLAYGAENMNVFVITSTILITMTMPNGRELTQTRRILSPGSTDFTRLERLNDLSRRYCATPMPLDVLEGELREIEKTPASRLLFYLGSALGAGSFAVFFGGTAADGIAGAAASVLVCFLQERLEPLCRNKIIFNFLASLIMGTAISGAVALLPFINTSHVTIGVIMLLIPGIAMTNSIRDILVGDTISGIMRLIESLFWSGGLACGFMAAIWLIGG